MLLVWHFEKVMAGYMQLLKKLEHMQQASEKDKPNQTANMGHGPQGVDKAPGEETPQDTVQFTQESQKGKKVDADPEQESDKPASQQDL